MKWKFAGVLAALSMAMTPLAQASSAPSRSMEIAPATEAAAGEQLANDGWLANPLEPASP